MTTAVPPQPSQRLAAVVLPAPIVIDDEEEVSATMDTEKKKRPLTVTERVAKCRAKKKAKNEEKKQLDAEKDALFSSLRRRENKVSQYCDSNLLLLIKIGTCPSAWGARALPGVYNSSPLTCFNLWSTVTSFLFCAV